MIRTLPPVLLALALLLVAGCSSSNDKDDSSQPGPIKARFVPAKPNPGMGEVATAQESFSGDLVTVRVTVTGISGIHSAEFRVFFNAVRAEWLGWTEGTLLGKDGASTSFTVTELAPGQLRIEARRTGTAATVDAVLTEGLIDLEFRVVKRGDAPLNFPTAVPGLPRALLDASSTELMGVAWWGGQLVGG